MVIMMMCVLCNKVAQQLLFFRFSQRYITLSAIERWDGLHGNVILQVPQHILADDDAVLHSFGKDAGYDTPGGAEEIGNIDDDNARDALRVMLLHHLCNGGGSKGQSLQGLGNPKQWHITSPPPPAVTSPTIAAAT